MKIQEMYIEVNIHYVIIKIHLSDFFSEQVIHMKKTESHVVVSYIFYKGK